MKKSFWIISASLAVSYSATAQLGDFDVDSSYRSRQSRTFTQMAADPSLKGSFFKNFLIGKNYRLEWTQPVSVPVLNISKDFGGLKADDEGGGKQTRNLKVIDDKGREWALRSVAKYPERGLPEIMQGTVAGKIYQDALSASYPYAVLSSGTLAKATGIRYLPNTLVVIPDDPALGEYRDKYKNQLSFMERRSVPMGGDVDANTDNTFKVMFKRHESNKVILDQTTLLRARLLDNFIMDFDRHEDQWSWLETDSAGLTKYIPIPKDRDQAFFDIDGFLPQLATRLSSTLGVFQGLAAKARNINTFNNSARDFDRAFLNEPDETIWRREIDRFLGAMTDGVIDEAMSRQPREVQRYQAPEIAAILKNKKQYFKEDMMEYYRSLSRIVDVTGSNEKELFTLKKNNDGSLAVQVQRMDDGKPAETIYRRTFDPAVTDEVRVYGMDDDDRFVVQGGDSPIKLRIVGGPGEDKFVNEGSGGKVWVYDVSFEDNEISGGGFREKISDHPMNNEYRQRGKIFRSNSFSIAAELTGESGLFLGPTLRIINPGFHKEPYASRNYFYVAKALGSSAWHLRWDADYIKVFKNTDLQLRSDVRLPAVQSYFFGYGNNTTINEDRSHYLAQYHRADVSLMLDHRLNNWLHIKAGPLAQYFRLLPSWNAGKYVSNIYPEGSVNDHLYDGLWYGGAGLRLEGDTKNDLLFPTQGINSYAYANTWRGMSDDAQNWQQVGAQFSFFTDFLLKHKLVLASNFGADHNLGDFEFPQAQYLGFKQNLRGYRFQRFAGRTRAYNNTELRANFGTVNFYLFKGMAGVLAFHDIGRVWTNNDTSDTWHRGYGGGIWVAPFNAMVVTGTLSFSKEEKNWAQASFGFRF